MKPTVGRIVHYHAYGTPGGEYKAVYRAAIIVEVAHLEKADGLWPEENHVKVKLMIFNPTGCHWNDAIYSEEPKPGTWCWPPKNG